MALRAALMATEARFMLSSWQGNRHRVNEALAALWGDCRVVAREHYYHVGAREANRNAMREALVMNYAGREDG